MSFIAYWTIQEPTKSHSFK